MKTTMKYKSFEIVVTRTTDGYVWEVRRADGSIYEESEDFESDSETEAFEEAKSVIDQFYSTE